MSKAICESDHILEEVAKETAKWIINNPNGNHFTSLYHSFRPILKKLCETSSWATISVKSGHAAYYYREMNELHNNDNSRRISDMIRFLGERNRIKTTTDFCHVLHEENTSLMIWSKSKAGSPCNKQIWNIDAAKLVKGIKDNDKNQKLTKLILSLEDNFNKKIVELENILRKCSNPDVHLPGIISDPSHHLLEYFSDIGFKIYIAILTVLEKEWKRITMLPSIIPAVHLHQLGGLVICEAGNKLLSYGSLRSWQKIACIPFWPWLLTARTTERNAVMLCTLGEINEATSNDYRPLEFIFGGLNYTLVDAEKTIIYKEGKGIEDINWSAEILGKHEVIRLLISALNARKTKGAARTEERLLTHLINMRQEDIESGEIRIRYLRGKEKHKKLYGMIREQIETNKKVPRERSNRIVDKQNNRRLERRRKIAAIKKPYTKISIIVPVVAQKERVDNFILCLKSYDAQSAIKMFPKNFELIILIDTAAGSISVAEAESMANEIAEEIRKSTSLRRVEYKIYVSNHHDFIGRSSIRNYGIANSSGDVVQLFDDSMLLHKEYLMEILVRFEHLRGQKFALIGFKERLWADRDFVLLMLELMFNGYLLPDSKYDWKKRELIKQSFSHPFQHIERNTEADYMELTGNLCFMNGSIQLGERSLDQFFSTGMVAFWKEEFISSGGFHPLFDSSWGMEDGHMGMLLIAKGNKIVPCYSALAFDLKHKKEKEKSDYKYMGGVPYNMKVLAKLKSWPITEQTKESFELNVKNNSAYFHQFLPAL